MKEREEISRYRQAAMFLPVRLRKLAETLPKEDQAVAEEFRLRTGWPMWYPARVRNRLGTCNAVHQAFTPVVLCADVACLAWARWMEDSRGFGSGQSQAAIAS